MPISVIVDWYGPYKSFEEFRADAAQEQRGRWLYAGVDKSAGRLACRYLGLSTSPGTRFQYHHVLTETPFDEYYLGEIVTAGLAGRRKSVHPADLSIAENALLVHLDSRMNKTNKNDPEDCVSIFSRFFDKKNPEKPRKDRAWVPELLAYNSWSNEWTWTM
ncbi:MAG: hypothetical protein AAF841_07595 [Pseudomonadota bacterium]